MGRVRFRATYPQMWLRPPPWSRFRRRNVSTNVLASAPEIPWRSSQPCMSLGPAPWSISSSMAPIVASKRRGSPATGPGNVRGFLPSGTSITTSV